LCSIEDVDQGKLERGINHFWKCYKMTLNSVAKFLDDWDVSPVVGMRLEILDKANYDVYDCTVTRIENGQIYVLRDDRSMEELADVICLQTPSQEEEEY
jgi:hypothetical protein